MVFFHETSEQISKENKKDEEDHSEPQNKVLAADKGGQLAQNEEAEIQKV